MELRPVEAMSGVEMRKHILRGEILEIDPSTVGGIRATGEKIRRDGVLNSQWDQGHEFTSGKSFRTLYTYVDLIRNDHQTRYKGAVYLYPHTPGASWTIGFESALEREGARLGLNALGNRAVADSSPTAPASSLAVLVAELRELPTIPGTQLLRQGLRPRSSGGEYLNVQFGWKPLINDTVKLARAVSRSREILEQYTRDSDRIVRRRRVLVDGDVQTTVTEKVPVTLASPVADYSGYDVGRMVGNTHYEALCLDKVTTDVWFSGAFSYHLEEADTLLEKLLLYEQMANRLLGSRLDATVLWELTPWSWLIDWFADVSSFVARTTRLSEDGLVLRYGYVMRKRVGERTFMLPDITSSAGRIPTPMTTYTSVLLERIKSTPYGFGLDVNAFSAQRWAILAALGMTRSDRNLR